ncbi:DUF397 domain-containing protein [Streptomyces sp. cg35]|uniref:DUF397 domain-containing protein n=1 Tax=Streptomyces sp. cg35 TaxID=3421650 RepID=UPI003D1757B0
MSHGREHARSWQEQVTGPWRKSSYSGLSGDCVEVALGETEVRVRDSGNRDTADLVFRRIRWQAFLRALGGSGPGRTDR